MKISRLFEIVHILLAKEKVTAKDLAEHFEVSRRTIYRDVETLSASGIPIYMSKGKNGGISLLPHYVLNKAVFTEEEKNNTLSALHSLNVLDPSSVEETLNKLSSFFGKNAASIYEIDFQDWGNRIEDSFETAKHAILSHKLLSFDYISSQNKKSHRTVEPYKLWFKNRTWYLKAYCLTKKELRIFRISRIGNSVVEEQRFVPREISEPDSMTMKQSAPKCEVIMRVEASMGYRIADEFPEEDVKRNPDGSYIVKMNLIEDRWLYGYILSFGASATVLEPERLKRIIQNEFKKSLANYL